VPIKDNFHFIFLNICREGLTVNIFRTSGQYESGRLLYSTLHSPERGEKPSCFASPNMDIGMGRYAKVLSGIYSKPGRTYVKAKFEGTASTGQIR
jgi:hypothetical protein